MELKTVLNDHCVWAKTQKSDSGDDGMVGGKDPDPCKTDSLK